MVSWAKVAGVLIFNSLRFIYVHIAKCGGTSIEKALDPYLRWNDIGLGGSDLGEIMQAEYGARFGLSKHSAARDIVRVIGSEAWLFYYSFATVRHPVARTASLYNYIQGRAEECGGELEFPLEGGPKERWAWARAVTLPDAEPWTYPAMRAYLGGLSDSRPFSAFLRHPALQADPAFAPQSLSLCGENGALLVNRAVQLERIDAFWPEFCRQFGLPACDLPRENVSCPRHRVCARELSRCEDDSDLIRSRFAEDFRLFGYEAISE
jgi:hypothetical protein